MTGAKDAHDDRCKYTLDNLETIYFRFGSGFATRPRLYLRYDDGTLLLPRRRRRGAMAGPSWAPGTHGGEQIRERERGIEHKL